MQIVALQQPRMLYGLEVERHRESERVLDAQHARAIRLRLPAMRQVLRGGERGQNIEIGVRSNLVTHLLDTGFTSKLQLERPFAILDTSQVQSCGGFVPRRPTRTKHQRVFLRSQNPSRAKR